MDSEFLKHRRCFLAPIPEIYDAARLLNEAVDKHIAENFSDAARLIKLADMSVIRNWTETLWGKVDPSIQRYRTIEGAPPVLSKDEKIQARMPSTSERQSILARDGHHCRFCGIPVIDPKVRKAIQQAYPTSLSWGRRNIEQHAAFQCMWLQYDHVLPHSRGGDNSIDNIVITCAPCNFGRMEYTLDELGLENPLEHPAVVSKWDGLERFLTHCS